MDDSNKEFNEELSGKIDCTNKKMDDTNKKIDELKQDRQRNMEVLNEKIEEMTEVKKEISEINEKWKQTSNKLQQTKESINTRVNNLEEANQIQIAAIQQKTEDEVNQLKTNTEERCMGIETTLNTIQTLSLIHI